jgi:predicted ester cyclase
MTIEQVLEGPHQVVWRFRVRGTQRGELLGTPPSRRQVDIGGIVWSRFENGLWAEDHAQWDALAMMRQIDAQSGISTSSCAASTSA